MQDKSLKKYLESSEFIDFNTPEIIELAKKISQGLTKDQEEQYSLWVVLSAFVTRRCWFTI